MCDRNAVLFTNYLNDKMKQFESSNFCLVHLVANFGSTNVVNCFEGSEIHKDHKLEEEYGHVSLPAQDEVGDPLNVILQGNNSS